MPFIGQPTAGGIDALDTVTNSTEPSSGQQLVAAYLMSKGLPMNGENMRRALTANAQNPGLIPQLANNAPSTDAEDYAAGARGPRSPGDPGPAVAQRTSSGGGAARRIEGGGAQRGGSGSVDEGGWDTGAGAPAPTNKTSGGTPRGAVPSETLPAADAPRGGTSISNPSEGWNWPMILGTGAGLGAAGITGASLLNAARGGSGGGTSSAPPTPRGAPIEPPPIPPRGGAAPGESITMPQSRPVAEGEPVVIPEGMRPVGSAAAPGASIMQPGVTPTAAPSTAVDIERVLNNGVPPPVPPPSMANAYANRPRQAGAPGTAARAASEAPPAFTPPAANTSAAERYTQRPGQPQAAPVEPAPEFVNEMAAQRAQRPMQPGPSSPNPIARNTSVATDPARTAQITRNTGVPAPDMATRARILQAIKEQAEGARRLGTVMMRR